MTNMTPEQVIEMFPDCPTTLMVFTCGHTAVVKRNLANPDVPGDVGHYSVQMPTFCCDCLNSR